MIASMIKFLIEAMSSREIESIVIFSIESVEFYILFPKFLYAYRPYPNTN